MMTGNRFKINFIFVILISLFFSLPFLYSQSGSKKPLSESPTQIKQYVFDETGTLTPPQVVNLINKLQAEDKATTNQIIVYMISSLDGESLEDLSIELAEKNKIGKKDRNNGVLLLIVKDDRKIRLEVGYGLEGVLTDATSSSIIRNIITPEFKKNNYYEGIDKGVDAIISAIKGEYAADKNSVDKDGGLCLGIPVFIIVIFGFIFVFIFTSFVKSIFGAGRSIYTGKKGWDNSGWWGGGGSGGSWGGGSGGGGFSGGGGSFGGGGASGSW